MNKNKIPLRAYMLAIPPVALLFIGWYLFQFAKVAYTHGFKFAAQAVYTQTAIATDKDATELNQAVEKYHQDEAQEPISNLHRFENLAILCLFATGVAFFTLPEEDKYFPVMPILWAMQVPQAAESTIKQHFHISHKGD